MEAKHTLFGLLSCLICFSCKDGIVKREPSIKDGVTLRDIEFFGLKGHVREFEKMVWQDPDSGMIRMSYMEFFEVIDSYLAYCKIHYNDLLKVPPEKRGCYTRVSVETNCFDEHGYLKWTERLSSVDAFVDRINYNIKNEHMSSARSDVPEESEFGGRGQLRRSNTSTFSFEFHNKDIAQNDEIVLAKDRTVTHTTSGTKMLKNNEIVFYTQKTGQKLSETDSVIVWEEKIATQNYNAPLKTITDTATYNILKKDEHGNPTLAIRTHSYAAYPRDLVMCSYSYFSTSEAGK